MLRSVSKSALDMLLARFSCLSATCRERNHRAMDVLGLAGLARPNFFFFLVGRRSMSNFWCRIRIRIRNTEKPAKNPLKIR